MDKYLFKKKFNGRYLLKKVPIIGERTYKVYYVDYPSTNDDDGLNWSFFIVSIDPYRGCHCGDWNISKEEQEEIKNYIRTVLKPNDYNEFNFVKEILGRVRVKSIEVNGGYVDYYVDYPSKGEVKDWSFHIGSDNKNTNGEFKIEPWNISELEAEYLKNYIRNVLKPADLYESEEKKMDKGFKDRLVFIIPEEKHDDVKRIVEAFINNEDEYMVDDMLVDEYLDMVKQRDELQEQLDNMPEDQNPLDVAEIEKLKDENRMLRSELAAISEKNEGKSILEMPLSEVLEVIDNMKKGIGNKVIICKEN